MRFVKFEKIGDIAYPQEPKVPLAKTYKHGFSFILFARHQRKIRCLIFFSYRLNRKIFAVKVKIHDIFTNF